MVFEYNEKAVFTESIDLVDAGNTALRALNDKGFEFYLILKTDFGKTKMLKFGPVMSDVPMLVDGFSVAYSKVDYKESILNKNIDQFINDYKRGITKVEEITEYEAFKVLPDISKLFMEEELD